MASELTGFSPDMHGSIEESPDPQTQLPWVPGSEGLSALDSLCKRLCHKHHQKQSGSVLHL